MNKSLYIEKKERERERKREVEVQHAHASLHLFVLESFWRGKFRFAFDPKTEWNVC